MMQELSGPEWTSIGMVGVLALLLVREVFAFLKSQPGKSSSNLELDLLMNEIRRLNASITSLTEALTNVIVECRETKNSVAEIRRDLDELKGRIK